MSTLEILNNPNPNSFMSNVLKMGRRAFTAGVVGATIAWSIGVAGLLQPLATSAATAGTLIKGSLPAVYYAGADGKRYVFPNEKTFKTWYGDFSGVTTLSDTDIAAIAIGGNAVYRGGARLIKIQSDPKVYAVEPMGKIRWLESEAVASALYGSNWASRVQDVADVFFSDYTPSASVSSAATYPVGTLLKNAGSDNVYIVSAAGQKQWIDAAGMAANHYMASNVVTTTQNLAVYTDGANISGAVAALADVSQHGGGTTSGGTTSGGTGGTLSVSLASDTPASATAPRIASSVPLFAFNLSSSGGASTISTIVAHRFGVGAGTDLANVYLYDGATRLTDGRAVATQTNEVTFSGLNLSIADGTTKKLWMKANVNTATSGGVHGFQIVSADKISSNGTVTGSFPVSGNQITISNGTSGTVTISGNGTISNPSVGQTNAEIARFQLQVSNEAATIGSLTFSLSGSARNSDFSNFTLWQGSTKLATTAAVSGTNLVVFSLTSPFAMADGTTRIFSVHADLSGAAARTIGVRLAEPSDLAAVGGNFGFGMQITSGAFNGGAGAGAGSGTCLATTDDCSFSTMQGSTLTLAFNGPAASDLSRNSQTNHLLDFSLTAQQFTTVRDLSVRVACGVCTDGTGDGGLIRAVSGTATEQNLQHVKIINADTGTIIMGPLELVLAGSDTTQDLAFTEDFTVTAGQTIKMAVVSDVDDEVAAANTFSATIVMSTLTTATDQNNDTLAANQIVPSANIAGNAMTIRAAALTITFSQPPSDGTNQNHVRGSSNVPTVGYSFTAAQGSDITVTSAVYTVSVVSNAGTTGSAAPTGFVVGTSTDTDSPVLAVVARDIVSSASLYDGDTGALVAGPNAIQTTPTGTVNFQNFTWVVPKGTTKKLIVRTNIANYSVSGSADAYAFRIAAPATDVTSRDANGNNVAPTAGANNNTAAAPTVYVRVTNGGSLATSLAANSPRSDLLLMGATDMPISRFVFSATDEAFVITDVALDETGAFRNNGGASSGGYDNNILSLKLTYPKQDGTTGTSTGFLTAGLAQFSGLSMYVAGNSSATLTVLATMNTFPNATSGAKPELDLGTNVTTTRFRAVGQSSGFTMTEATTPALTGTSALIVNSVTHADAMLGAYRHVVRRTAPTLALAAGSPTSGSPGLSEVYRFAVSSAAGAATVLETITFKITATDNNGDTGTSGAADDWNTCLATQGSGVSSDQLDVNDFTLFDAASPNTPIDTSDGLWTLLDATGLGCVSNAARVVFARLDLGTSPEIIAAGSTKTYQLYVDTTGASSANRDSFRVDIVNESIVSTFLNPSRTFSGVGTATATSLTISAGSNVLVGDLICNGSTTGTATVCDSGDEIMLVTATATSDTVLTVSRGELGHAAAATANANVVLRMPASLYWDDDGLAPVSTATAASGYLVHGLDVRGNTIGY